jgi:hypothetical protein
MLRCDLDGLIDISAVEEIETRDPSFVSAKGPSVTRSWRRLLSLLETHSSVLSWAGSKGSAEGSTHTNIR